MFIPRGKPVHENLATSYLLVDQLATDLCDQVFSGVIEVTLRDCIAFVVVAHGKLAGVVERRGEAWDETTLDQLAERSRLERGNVSVFAYDAATADAVAGRLRAQPLYVGLNTGFTDPRRVLSKLANERDREWFIEITSTDGNAALINLREGRCLVINAMAQPVEECDAASLARNVEIGRLVEECNRVGGAFDVLFNYSGQLGVVKASQPSSASLAPENSDASVGASDKIVASAQDEKAPVGEAVTQVKRLLGEIAGAIEEAARAVGPHESFAMSLRAAGLQIADRYAFLDPFGGEFEYLGGDIVLAGPIAVEELIVGVTEALTLTVEDLARTTAYADRFRAYVSEDLRRLLASNLAEFERFSLDQVIHHLIEVVSTNQPARVALTPSE
ncbi:MAG TPA: hypothetical protein VGL29_01050 [Blastocatellia bacterium]